MPKCESELNRGGKKDERSWRKKAWEKVSKKRNETEMKKGIQKHEMSDKRRSERLTKSQSKERER